VRGWNWLLLLLVLIYPWWRLSSAPSDNGDAGAQRPPAVAVAALQLLPPAVPELPLALSDTHLEPPPALCGTVGPLPEGARERQWRSSLAVAGDRLAAPRAVLEQAARGWRVVAPAAGRAEAGALLQRLRGSGQDDAFLIAEGERAEVSLGFFKVEDNARRLQGRLTSLGFEVTVRTEYEPRRFWWQDFSQMVEADAAAERLRSLGFAGVRSLVIPCPTVEAAVAPPR